MTLRDDLAAVLGPGNDDRIAYDQADSVLAVLAQGDAHEVRTWYRCRVLADDSLWCETSDPRECLLAAQSAPGPTVLQRYAVIEYETPWATWTPTAEALAQERQDHAEDEAAWR